jgi:hypothetical protein
MISLRTSTEIRGRPGPRLLLFHRQKSRNPLRCQARTVDGFTIARLSLQPSQKRESRAQKTRSTGRSLGRVPRCTRHESWWRSATFSATRSARSLKNGSSNGEKQCKLERHSANDSLGPDTAEKACKFGSVSNNDEAQVSTDMSITPRPRLSCPSPGLFIGFTQLRGIRLMCVVRAMDLHSRRRATQHIDRNLAKTTRAQCNFELPGICVLLRHETGWHKR